MKEKQLDKVGRVSAPCADQVAFYFPVHGCESVKPLSEAEMNKRREFALANIRKHWDNDGVRSIIEMIEIQAAILQARACARGADQHDAGGAHHLLQLVRSLQNKRWGAA